MLQAKMVPKADLDAELLDVVDGYVGILDDQRRNVVR